MAAGPDAITIDTLERELALARAERDQALEQQSATAEILRVIAQSPTDIGPVMTAVAKAAVRFCGAEDAHVFLRDGNEMVSSAHEGPLSAHRPGYRDALDASVTARADTILGARVTHIPDTLAPEAEAAYSLIRENSIQHAFRAQLNAPMLKDGQAIGCICLRRRDPGPFTPRQIALLETFAAQAVIAIENVRLFTELRESLEQQTASADVLRVISQSPTSVQPVFDVIAESALRLLGGWSVIVWRYDGSRLHIGAAKGGHPGSSEALPTMFEGLSPDDIFVGDAVRRGEVQRIIDVETEPVAPQLRKLAQARGWRSNLAVPMMREGQPVGVFTLARAEPGAFTERDVQLLQSFAAQAVIAIENVRLFTELREALEQQTATSEILRVISRSPTDVSPVLDAVAKAALRFCGAQDSVVLLREGDQWVIAGHEGPMSAEIGSRQPLNRQTAPGRAMLDARTAHFADVLALDPVEYAAAHEFSRRHGFRAALAAPMLREGQAIGAIALRRAEPGAFTERQIEVLESFAAQAVIALENTRLFTELKESLDYQTATSDVLSVISRSTSELEPVLRSMLAAATRLCGVHMGGVAVRRGDVLRYVTSTGVSAEFDKWLRETPHPIDRSSIAGRAAADKRVTYIRNVAADPDYAMPHTTTVGNMQSLLAVPLLREDEVVGVMTLGRSNTEPFTERQIGLVRTFADQAVIAMENTRLLADLRESLDYQTATSEVLEVISRSTSDLAPVLNTMLAAAARLCGVGKGDVSIRRDGQMRYAASIGTSPAEDAWLRSRVIAADRSTCAGRAMITRQVVHVLDQSADPELAVPRQISAHQTVLSVPLLRGDEAIGVITVLRDHVEAFTERQIALIKTFADQAVIAIENARLLGELRERTDDLQQSLEYQTAISDVLSVISRSTSEVEPVLNVMLAAAARLCDATGGGVTTKQEQGFRYVASFGWPDEFDKVARANDHGPGQATVAGRAVRERRVVQFTDLTADPDYMLSDAVRHFGVKAALGVPLLREGEPIGAIALTRDHVEPFTDRQIALIRTFADQAVIAIENARLLGELRERTDDLTESLEYQTATSDLLEVISRSTSDIQPVLDRMLSSAARLCGVAKGDVAIRHGDVFRHVAFIGSATPEENAWLRSRVTVPGRGTSTARALLEKQVDHVLDQSRDPERVAPAAATAARTTLAVPLLREGEAIGVISLLRDHVEPFTDRQIALVKTFADQAVIAMENARLLSELTQRTDDLAESLEYQTATAEVLGVISRSPTTLQPVLEAMTAAAVRLCGVKTGGLSVRRGDRLEFVALVGQTPAFERWQAGTPIPVARGVPLGDAILDKAPVQIVDVMETDAYKAGAEVERAVVDLGGHRTILHVPLLREDEAIGVLTVSRGEPLAFTERQIGLIETFADQAVIAMENARLLSELRERQNELRVTFDNMGDAVVMFDAERRLAAWNRNFQEMLDVSDAFLAARPTLDDYVRLLIERGELGEVDIDSEMVRFRERFEQQWSAERTRPNGRILEVRNNPVPGGGAVLIYSDITERKKAEADIRAARDAAEATLLQLKAAQANLVQSEKMASLGQLTAGIAHEIKNPLNFVNNFAILSVELLDELKEIAGPALETLDADKRAELDETMDLLTGNLGKIAEHGKRADGIVKSMLSHSRGGSGDWQASDINALVEEALNLAYHGARAQDKEFNVTLEREFATDSKPIEVVPQDVTRVFLNLFGNGFYAASKRRLAKEAGFRPTLTVSTRDLGGTVEVKVRDNGIGIPPEVREKLFQPFFTTKPTGEGTGLGLSISYDIVTQQHGGTIGVESEVGNFTEFTVRLPRIPRVASAKRA